MCEQSKKNFPPCKYNACVLCDRKPDAGCEHCGWEPEQNRRRREKVRKIRMADDWYHKLWQHYEPLQ